MRAHHTQERLAHRRRLSRSTLQSIEKGEPAAPRFSALRRAADALRVRVHDLLRAGHTARLKTAPLCDPDRVGPSGRMIQLQHPGSVELLPQLCERCRSMNGAAGPLLGEVLLRLIAPANIFEVAHFV